MHFSYVLQLVYIKFLMKCSDLKITPILPILLWRYMHNQSVMYKLKMLSGRYFYLAQIRAVSRHFKLANSNL